MKAIDVGSYWGNFALQRFRYRAVTRNARREVKELELLKPFRGNLNRIGGVFGVSEKIFRGFRWFHVS